MGKIDRMLNDFGYQKHFKADDGCRTCAYCQHRNGDLYCNNTTLLDALDYDFHDAEIAVEQYAICNEYMPAKERQEVIDAENNYYKQRQQRMERLTGVSEELMDALNNVLIACKLVGISGKPFDEAADVLKKARGER